MLGDNRGTALHNHIIALERLQEVKDEAAGDFNERKKLAKEDGFDTNVIAAILKRRKNGEGMTQAFDDLLQEYEFAIAEQKGLPLEKKIEAELRVRYGDGVSFDRVAPDEEVGTQADDDELYVSALALVVEHRKASTAWLQRKLTIGYNAAARIIERMQENGHVSAPDHVGRREVLMPAAYPAEHGAN